MNGQIKHDFIENNKINYKKKAYNNFKKDFFSDYFLKSD